MQVDKSIVCRDIAYFRVQAKDNFKKYIDVGNSVLVQIQEQKQTAKLSEILKNATEALITNNSIIAYQTIA